VPSPRFPLPCGTVTSSSEISRIVGVRVTPGSSVDDVDPQSSLCNFDNYHDGESNLNVDVDGSPTDYESELRVLSTGGKYLQTEPGLGARVSVQTTPRGCKVAAFYGSWYIYVDEQASGGAKPYSTNQMLAIARNVFQHLTGPNSHPNGGSGPKAGA
jgi:hypothetical protein